MIGPVNKKEVGRKVLRYLVTKRDFDLTLIEASELRLRAHNLRIIDEILASEFHDSEEFAANPPKRGCYGMMFWLGFWSEWELWRDEDPFSARAAGVPCTV